MFTEENVPTHDGEGCLGEVRHPKEVAKDISVAGLRDGADEVEIVVVDVARVSVGGAARHGPSLSMMLLIAALVIEPPALRRRAAAEAATFATEGLCACATRDQAPAPESS